jgi:hypothetical protein
VDSENLIGGPALPSVGRKFLMAPEESGTVFLLRATDRTIIGAPAEVIAERRDFSKPP